MDSVATKLEIVSNVLVRNQTQLFESIANSRPRLSVLNFSSNFVLAEFRALSRAQRSTMDKKIWLSMHPRNFSSDKIVGTSYVRPPFMLADVKCLISLESQRHTVYKLCST